MRCPLCVDEELQVTFRSGIEVDVCPRCRGVWLDRGELDRLADGTASSGAGFQPPAPSDRVAPDPIDDAGSTMAAPPPPRPRSPRPPMGDEKPTGYEKPKRPDKPRKKKKRKKKDLDDRLEDLFEELFDFFD